MMNWNHSAHKSLRSIAIALGASALLFPALSFASQPDVDCMSLADDDSQKFYELSGLAQESAQNGDLDGALKYSLQAMRMCTSDAFTEYNLARIYQKRNNCPAALYHYERLNNRLSDIKKEDADLAKGIKKYYAEVSKECPEAVNIEITCATPETKIQLVGAIDSAVECPVYTKVLPNSYALSATRESYYPHKDTVTVTPDGLVYEVPELQDVNNNGTLRVKCPKNANFFILTDANGNVSEYQCPWEGNVAVGTYKVRVGNADPSSDMEVVVTKGQVFEHQIPAAAKSSCSASSVAASSQGGFAALIMAALAAFGFVALRRRRED